MVDVAERQRDRHECGVCGHIGEDVVWEDTPYKPGYYCQDGLACFDRYRQQRNQEPEDISGNA